MAVTKILSSYRGKNAEGEERKITLYYYTGGLYEAHFTMVKRKGYFEVSTPYEDKNFRVAIHVCGRRTKKQDTIAIDMLEDYINRNNLGEC